MRVPLPTRRATANLAAALGATLRGGDLLILEGPLGAGKTHLVRALALALGLPRGVRVTSPTFALVQEYPTLPPLAHADLYRLRDSGGVEDLGLEELRERGRLLAVEWGASHEAALGGDALQVTLAVAPRAATLHATGPRSAERLEALLRGSRVPV